MRRELLAIDEQSKTKFPKMSEAKQDLPYLSNDIVKLILAKIPWKERLRLSLVCKSWKKLYDGTQDSEECLPWVMSFDWDEKVAGGTCKLSDPSTQTSYVLKEPTDRTERGLFYNALGCDSKYGWVLFSKVIAKESGLSGYCYNLLFLYSPFRNKIIKLPMLKMIDGRYKASFSSNPSSPDCTVIVVSPHRGKLYIRTCYLDDKLWKTFELSGEFEDYMYLLRNVVYAGGYFYCAFLNGELGAFDAKQQEWKLLGEAQLPQKKGILVSRPLYIAFNGDLVMPYYELKRDLGWRFRRFDFLEKKWVDIDGAKIKKHAIFFYSSPLVGCSSFSVPDLGNARESAGKIHCIHSGVRMPLYSSIFDHTDERPSKAYEWLEDNELRKIWIHPPFLKSFS